MVGSQEEFVTNRFSITDLCAILILDSKFYVNACIDASSVLDILSYRLHIPHHISNPNFVTVNNTVSLAIQTLSSPHFPTSSRTPSSTSIHSSTQAPSQSS